MQSRNGKSWALLGLFGTLNMLASLAGAQTLSGRVVDAAGSPVSGAKVALIQSKINVTTGTDGSFELKFGAALRSQNGQGPDGPGFSIQGDRLRLEVMEPQALTIAIYSPSGKKTITLADRFFQSGRYDISLPAEGVHLSPGYYILGIHYHQAETYSRFFLSGHADPVSPGEAFPSPAAALSKSASSTAVADTLAISKPGYFTKRTTLESLATQSLGDYILGLDKLYSRNATFDLDDQIILDVTAKNNLNASMAMVVKAMIVIESAFKANAISMYDSQLPCGTHSYGLIQVTPGCEVGYATLPAGTKVTATISGGLNQVPATLTYADPADKASGNTVVMESGIIIDLVSDPANPFWATSAFNPAYSIDNGAKAVANVMADMQARFQGCTEANYVSMALAGYNQGNSQVFGCTSYSANGTNYANSVLAEYRTLCKLAGLTAVY